MLTCCKQGSALQQISSHACSAGVANPFAGINIENFDAGQFCGMLDELHFVHISLSSDNRNVLTINAQP